MINIKHKYKAIIIACISGLFVGLLGLIIILEKDFYKTQTLNNTEYQKIIYAVLTKNFSEIYLYETETDKTKLLYTDNDEQFKISNISAFDPQNNILIVQENKPDQENELLTKIDLNTGKRNILNDNFHFYLFKSNIFLDNSIKFIPNQNEFTLLQDTPMQIANKITNFQNLPDDIIYIAEKNAIIAKQKDQNIFYIINDKKGEVENSSNSPIYYFNNKLYYYSDKKIIIKNFDTLKDKTIIEINELPLSIYVKDNFILYTYTKEDGTTTIKVISDNEIKEFEIDATKILGIE